MNISTKNWLLLDGVGAITTATMCLVVAKFESYIGMPKKVMFILSSVAFCFAVFSFSSRLLAKKYFEKYLSIVLTANAFYCLATFVLVSIHIRQLTKLGMAYFVGEIIIVLIIVYAEYRKVKRSNASQKADI